MEALKLLEEDLIIIMLLDIKSYIIIVAEQLLKTTNS